jgi:hypothetical protein
MGLARCEACGRPQGLRYRNNHLHTQAFSAHRKIVCGLQTCLGRGFIWLTDEEEQQYLSGQRRFLVSNRAVQVT